MNYTDFTTALVILFEQNDATNTYTFAKSPDFTNYLPRIIEQAEAQLYREVCPLAARQGIMIGPVTPGSRIIPLASLVPFPVVVEGLSLVTPEGDTPANGTRIQFRQTTLDFISFAWPTESQMMAPDAAYPECYWAFHDAQNLVIAPTPDLAYNAVATGTIRPTPLSMANPDTYLSDYYPDLFLYSAAIATAGFLRDYGSQSDDPKIALSWGARYGELKASALEEERRRRGDMPGTFALPSSAGTPPMPPAQGR